MGGWPGWKDRWIVLTPSMRNANQSETDANCLYYVQRYLVDNQEGA